MNIASNYSNFLNLPRALVKKQAKFQQAFGMPAARDTVSFGNSLKIVTLRTGIESHEPLVCTTMMALDALSQEGLPGLLAVYDLAQKCRNKDYKFFGNAEQKLKEYALVDKSGSIHNAIKDIVIAATEGDGLDFKLVNPIKKD